MSTAAAGSSGSAPAKFKWGTTATDLVIDNVVLLVSEASRGVVLSTLFSYIVEVTGGAQDDHARSMLSIAIALFSVGRLLASTVLGYWIDRSRPRVVLFWSLLLHAIGQVLYGFGGTWGLWAIMLSRFLIGFGSGTLGVCRSVAANLVDKTERGKQFAFLGMSKFIGYAITPAVAIALVCNTTILGVPFTTQTAPGFIMAAICVVLAIVTVVGMRDVGPPPAATVAPTTTVLATAAVAGPAVAAAAKPSRLEVFQAKLRLALRPHLWSVFLAGSVLFVLINLVTKGVLTMVEATISPDYTLAHADTDSDAISDSAEYLLFLGLGGFVAYAFMVLKPTKDPQAAPAAAPRSPRRGGQRSNSRSPFAANKYEPVDVALAEPLTPGGFVIDTGVAPVAPDRMTLDQSRRASVVSHSTSVNAPGRDAFPVFGFARASASKGGPDPFSDGIDLLSHGAAAPAAAEEADSARPCHRRCAASALRRLQWAWARCGPAADPWLLVMALLVSATGALLASPAPKAGNGLPLMTAGFALIWSVGAPVADILGASMYSVLVTEAGGKQGRAMGWITAAGSLGRITFPLIFSFMSHSVTLIFAGVVCVLCAAALVPYVRKVKRLAAEKATQQRAKEEAAAAAAAAAKAAAAAAAPVDFAPAAAVVAL